MLTWRVRVNDLFIKISQTQIVISVFLNKWTNTGLFFVYFYSYRNPKKYLPMVSTNK